jgi:hypothetical protein
VPGYNPQTIALNVQNGNQVAIMLGDLLVSFAQTCSTQISFGTEQLYGIGTALPQEVQQLRISPSFSLDSFSLTAAGLTILSNNQRLEYLLAGKSFEMHVLDGLTNTVMFSYVGAKAQNVGLSIPTNAPLRSTYAFLALNVLDPFGNSIINDGLNLISVAVPVAAVAAPFGL